jgi:hypothetical protein
MSSVVVSYKAAITEGLILGAGNHFEICSSCCLFAERQIAYP